MSKTRTAYQVREYVATVTLPKGGTECVTVSACSVQAAYERLLRMGYINPRDIT